MTIFFLVFAILLESLASATTIGIQCFVPGECLNSQILSSKITPDSKACLKHCQDDVISCEWFTYYSNTKTCTALSGCLDLNSTFCSDCVSGEDQCPEFMCGIPGRCFGALEGERAATTEDQCHDHCLSNDKCLWHSYNPEHQECVMTNDCPAVDKTCNNCTSWERGCLDAPTTTLATATTTTTTTTETTITTTTTTTRTTTTTTTVPPLLKNCDISANTILQGAFSRCTDDYFITGYSRHQYSDSTPNGRVADQYCCEPFSGEISRDACVALPALASGEISCPTGKLPSNICNTAESRYICDHDKKNINLSCCDYKINGRSTSARMTDPQCHWLWGSLDDVLRCEQDEVVVATCGSEEFDKPTCNHNNSSLGIRCCPLEVGP